MPNTAHGTPETYPKGEGQLAHDDDNFEYDFVEFEEHAHYLLNQDHTNDALDILLCKLREQTATLQTVTAFTSDDKPVLLKLNV
jgi:hypothetical protein